MDAEKIMTFIVGAGSAGTVVGSILLWRIKRAMEHLDEVPMLVKSNREMKTAIDKMTGELKLIERTMYRNQVDIANTMKTAEASFVKISNLRQEIR